MMRRTGAAHLKRVLAFVMTLMMAIGAWVMPAAALEGAESLMINVLWTDAQGNMQAVPAAPVDLGGKWVYWARLDPAALGTWLTVQVIHPDPEYTFFTMNSNDQLQWLPEDDAVSLEDQYAQYIGYSIGGEFQNEFVLLYLSSQMTPEQLAPGGESIQPEESIRPDVPVQSEVSIPVYYMTEDGMLLDTQYVTCYTGQSVDVWASSSLTAGYSIVGSNFVQVFVDSMGVSNIPQVVFTFRPDAPAAPAEANVPVYYYHVNGTMLDMQEKTLPEGEHTVWPESSKVGSYTLIGDQSQTIHVYSDGSTDLASIVFYYEDVYTAPAEANVPVYYYHVNGTMLDMQEKKLPEGEHTVWPESSKVGSYTLIGDQSQTIHVYSDGSTDLASIVFYYEDIAAAPQEASIPVYYYHENGTLLDVQEKTLPEGTYTIYPESNAVQGMKLISAEWVDVTVYRDGTASIPSISFIYRESVQSPVMGEATVIYQTRDGFMLDQKTVAVPTGYQTIRPESANTSGYDLVSEAAVEVYVDNGGAVSPNPVYFLYEMHKAAEAVVEVYYHDEMGNDVAPMQKRTLSDGTHAIKAEPQGLSPDYQLAYGMPAQLEITVQNGQASQNFVVFYYELKQIESIQPEQPVLPVEPVTATITVRYFDTMGKEIATAQTGTYTPGTHYIHAAPQDLPDGYELAMDATLEIIVREDGSYKPEEVGFYYRPMQEKAAAITIQYLDSLGNPVATAQTRNLTDGTHYIQPEPADLLEGYELFAGMEEPVEVIVRNGSASKSRVVFYYQKQTVVTQAPPTEQEVKVYYYDTYGNQIAQPDVKYLVPGTYQVYPDASKIPEGYELAMEGSLTVEVFADGKTEPPAEDVAFWYRPIQPKNGTVTVYYLDRAGYTIAGPFSYELTGSQTHTIHADPAFVPEGFDPASALPAEVKVSIYGVAEPAQATLTFEEYAVPVGEQVWRYAEVNKNDVAFRNEATTSGGNKTVIRRLNRSSKVFVMEELFNERGERWAYVMVNGRDGYMMSEYLSLMTVAQNAQYEATLSGTPVPTFTPQPTESFVEIIDPEAPADTSAPAPYQGYALADVTTSLRTGASTYDLVIQQLEKDTLVQVRQQVMGTNGTDVWSYVSTLSGQYGYVMDANLRYITDQQAQPHIDRWNQLNSAPEFIQPSTNTPSPVQVQGYAYAVGDNVPFRDSAYEYSNIRAYLMQGEVVYVAAQAYVDGEAWHRAAYNGAWGYVRSDLVRFMTKPEEDAYLDSLYNSNLPDIPEEEDDIPDAPTFDADGLSSYGYVSSNTVNFRKEASTQSGKIRELKKYAMCLVLGSEQIGNATWYHVKYGQSEGYIHGDYFYQMRISELSDFLNSEEYRQGLSSNSSAGSSGSDDLGYTGTGGLVSAEDQTVNQWQDPNSGVHVSYAPFVPAVGTPEPIATELPTLEPLPGWVATNTPLVAITTPTPTPTMAPIPNVTYPTASEPSDGSALIWIVVILMLVLVAGGIFAYIRYQQHRRRLALRAAQRRAQAARSTERPYARQAGQAVQPRTGMYGSQPQQRSSYAPQMTRSTESSMMQRPAAENASSAAQREEDVPPFETGYRMPYAAEDRAAADQTRPTGRVGRRTAYQQSLAQQRSNDESLDKENE